MTRTLVYLACPYVHPDPKVMEERVRAANITAAKLMAEGHIVFSPISHSHPIAKDAGLPLGWDYWGKFDTAFISYSIRLVVLMMPGWEKSQGVAKEIEIARSQGIPVEFIQPP